MSDAPREEPNYPRGHAYIRMRNRGYSINIDFPEVDSTCAERMIKAVMEILKADEAAHQGDD